MLAFFRTVILLFCWCLNFVWLFGTAPVKAEEPRAPPELGQVEKEVQNSSRAELSQLKVAPRLFRETSPFNSVIAPDAHIDGNSAVMVASLVSDALARGAVVAWSAWSVPLYKADATTQRYSIELELYHFNGFRVLDNVP